MTAISAMKEYRPMDRRDARETRWSEIAAWAKDQLVTDIEATGAGVEIVRSSHDWRGVTITLRQWQPYGLSTVVAHTVSFGRKTLNAGTDLEKSEVERAVTNRFSRILKRQRELTDAHGPVREDASCFDPALVTVDAPVLALIERYRPDIRDDLVMRALRREHGFDMEIENFARLLREHDIVDFSLDVNRSHIHGTFTLVLPTGQVVWKKGSVSILTGGTAPESVLMGLRGRPLSAAMDHPLIDGTLEITSAKQVRKNGIDGTVLTVKGHERPLPGTPGTKETRTTS